ncbi:hypothetical protein CEP50_16780 [Actinopolyspora mortivallis]|uniref:Uncharacterized protein n=1 Tax=Actinopolyspora mortivallis TaxID=33906 RepID=A0A2T0GSW0_ACTMO|nr:hypothetical protein CEP50_16780 [Actinopolyspora mortivallis]
MFYTVVLFADSQRHGLAASDQQDVPDENAVPTSGVPFRGRGDCETAPLGLRSHSLQDTEGTLPSSFRYLQRPGLAGHRERGVIPRDVIRHWHWHQRRVCTHRTIFQDEQILRTPPPPL